MHRSDDPRETTTYEIRVAGHLDARWAAHFEGLALRHEVDGTTVLSGLIPDQAALHGLLQRIRDLGVPLVSVARLRENRSPASRGSETNDH